MSDSSQPVVFWKWRVYDARNGRWRALRWSMTPEDAAEWAKAEGAQIERIEGSEEIRKNVSGGAEGWGKISGRPGWQTWHKDEPGGEQ